MSNLVKILFIKFVFLFSNLLVAQKDTIILFQDKHPINANEVPKIKKSNFGLYKDTTNLAWIEINEIGIYKTTTVLMQLPKEAVEKNEKYKVVDGWIYGVKKNDSLPCVLEDDQYVFGYPYRTEVLSYNGKFALKKIDNQTFLLNQQLKTDSTWQISQLYMDGNTIEFYSFDQYEFAKKNDTLQNTFLNYDEKEVIQSIKIKDPEFFLYPGIQKYFSLENVFVRKEDD